MVEGLNPQEAVARLEKFQQMFEVTMPAVCPTVSRLGCCHIMLAFACPVLHLALPVCNTIVSSGRNTIQPVQSSFGNAKFHNLRGHTAR